MKGVTILEALGELRDEFILEAELKEPIASEQTRKIRRTGSLSQSGLFAAAISVVVALGIVGAILLTGHLSDRPRPSPGGSATATDTESATDPYDADYDYSRLFTDMAPTWTIMDGCEVYEETATVLLPEDFTVPADFPAPDTLGTETWELTEASFTEWGFLVFRIENNVAYLKLIGSPATSATFALIGNTIFSLREGDYIRLNSGTVYVETSHSRITEPASGSDYLVTHIPNYLITHASVTRMTVAEVRQTYIVSCRHWDISIAGKPILYLYPTAPTVCSVRILTDQCITCTYPTYGTAGWQGFTAHPDGTLLFPDGMEYYALYWEGTYEGQWDFSSGFCVRGEDSAAFLEQVLAEIGLTRREANEFIMYWLPRMQDNAYNVISFQTDRYTEAFKLDITPEPDSLLRVFMAFYASDVPVDIPAQCIPGFVRNGFTVVEWGGTMCRAPRIGE